MDVPSDPAAAFPKRTRLGLLLWNLVPLLHLLATGGCAWLPCPTSVRISSALVVLYLLPALAGRWLASPLRGGDGRIPAADPRFLRWWASAQCQAVFCRLPFLEEVLRFVPGLYSAWLRLWGARIGGITYWSAGTRILDRGFLDIGHRVVFGAGVRMNAHVIVRNEDGRMELLLAPILVGDDAIIGGYSLLTAGTEIHPAEATRAFLISPPFSKWKDGRRTARDSS